MNCVSCDICVYHLGLFVFFPEVFLSPRVTGACPVTTDLTMRVNVRTSTVNNNNNRSPIFEGFCEGGALGGGRSLTAGAALSSHCCCTRRSVPSRGIRSARQVSDHPRYLWNGKRFKGNDRVVNLNPYRQVAVRSVCQPVAGIIRLLLRRLACG